MQTPEQRRAWKEKNREHLRSQDRERYRNLSNEQKQVIFSKINRAAKRLYGARTIAKKFGYVPPNISIEEYQHLLDTVHNCECCSEKLTIKYLDHNHETGKVRGIVCASCNKAEGFVKTVSRAKALLNYMEKHNA